MLKLLADVKVHQKIGEFSVDVFIPEWKLAIEYQGGQHLKQSWHGDLSRYC
jgi:very-short-patch-repair endonuclease